MAPFTRFASMPVQFHSEGVQFRLANRTKLIDAIKFIGLLEQKELGDINVVFVSDKRLLGLNRRFLSHDYYTDIVTFQYPAPPTVISGDLYISKDRVLDNSKSLGLLFTDELSRVIIHGVLHLCGYRDKTHVEKKLMRKKEDFYLNSMKSL
ncbi:MAG TPA: rRNA maturation RNase YbeY [Chitinophagales bacterium]|nr:rRNA maturation RNase YbeY [Chitinophagales bacterium]